MKYFFSFIVIILSVFIAEKSYSQVANVQIIHNSADPELAKIDIYVNGVPIPALQDISFRSASPFLTLPSSTQLQIGIAPGHTSGAGGIVKSFTFTPESGKTYIAMICGVGDPTMFSTNFDPNAKPLALNCEIIGGQSVAQNTNKVEILVFHGATDAPAVDLLINGNKVPELSGLSYGKNSGYISFDPAIYTIGVAPAGGSALGSFQANLMAETGKAMVILASGFLNPAINQSGEPFGLFSVSAAGGKFTSLSAGTTDIEEEVKENSVSVYYDNTGQMATATFSLQKESDILFYLYDMNGIPLMKLNKGILPQGVNTVQADITTLPSGIYSMLIDAGNEILRCKIFVIH